MAVAGTQGQLVVVGALNTALPSLLRNKPCG
jgi:hypothetical protein